MRINVNNSSLWNWNEVKSKLSRLIYTSEGKRKRSFNIALVLSVLLTVFAFGNFTAGVIAQRNYAVSNMLFKPLILDTKAGIPQQFASATDTVFILAYTGGTSISTISPSASLQVLI